MNCLLDFVRVGKSSLVTKFANDNGPRATYDRNPRGHKIEIDIDGRRWMLKVTKLYMYREKERQKKKNMFKIYRK